MTTTNRILRRVLPACFSTATSLCHAVTPPDHPSDLGPAASSSYWEVVAAPFALHWSNETAHRHVILLGLEHTQIDGSMWGAAAFRNSFGQPSAYGYYGHVWNGVFNQPQLYTKLSGGVLYGYKGQYRNKVPFNHHGFGLAVIPALGWRLSERDSLQVSVLGTAALVFSYNRRF